MTYRDGQNTEDDPNSEIAVADERDGRDITDTPTVSANPDRILFAGTANAVQGSPGPGTGGPALNVAPVFDPESVTIEVPENTPSTGYVDTPVVANDAGDTLTYDLSGVDARNFALADRNLTYYDADLMRSTGPSQIALKPVTQLDPTSLVRSTRSKSVPPIHKAKGLPRRW